jgi:hypothetical protein
MVLPYLKGFVYILVFIIGERFGIFLVIYELYLTFFIISIEVFKNWYQSSFLGKRREQIFGSFCKFVQREKGGGALQT